MANIEVQNHLHADRRGARARHLLLAADRPGVRRRRATSRSRRATSRWPGASSPRFPEQLTPAQRLPDALAELGELAQDARSEHHQAAEHQRLDAAAEGRHRRAAGAGLRAARLSRRPAERRGEGDPGALRQGQGQRRQPGAARGQLRPPRAQRRQAVRAEATRTRWAPGRQTRRRTSRT